MADVKAKIADVEQYMKSLSVSLEAIRGLDRDIEQLAAENKRIEAENTRIEELIEKCRKDIDHYRFEDTGFGPLLDQEQQAAIFDQDACPALEDPDSPLSALTVQKKEAESSRPDNLATPPDFDGLLPTRSLNHRLGTATGSERHRSQSRAPPVVMMPSGPAYQPATSGLAEPSASPTSVMAEALGGSGMQRAIESLSSDPFEERRVDLPPPPHSQPSRPKPNAFADFVDPLPSQAPSGEFKLIANDVGVGVVTSLGAPVAVTIPGSS
jgi:hypothetical protein